MYFEVTLTEVIGHLEVELREGKGKPPEQLNKNPIFFSIKGKNELKSYKQVRSIVGAGRTLIPKSKKLFLTIFDFVPKLSERRYVSLRGEPRAVEGIILGHELLNGRGRTRRGGQGVVGW